MIYLSIHVHFYPEQCRRTFLYQSCLHNTLVLNFRLGLFQLMMELEKKLWLRFQHIWKPTKHSIQIPMVVISLKGFVACLPWYISMLMEHVWIAIFYHCNLVVHSLMEIIILQIRDYRKDWNLEVNQPVAGNYYPVCLIHHYIIS